MDPEPYEATEAATQERLPLGTKRPLEGSAAEEASTGGANGGGGKKRHHQREQLRSSPTKAVAATATEETQPAAAAAAPPLGSNDENALQERDEDADEKEADEGEEVEVEDNDDNDDEDDDDFFDQSLIEGGDRAQKLLARLLKSRRDEARRAAAAAERLEKIARAGAARQETACGRRRKGGEEAEEDEAAAAEAAEAASAALALESGGAGGGGGGSGAGSGEGPDAAIDENPLHRRCWWPPPSTEGKSWPDKKADAARLSQLGRTLLLPSLAAEEEGKKQRGSASSSSASDFDQLVAPFVDKEALGRSALSSGLFAAEAAEAAEGEEAGDSSSFISAAAPALVALAVGGDPTLAAPALAALRATWSLDSPWIPSPASAVVSAVVAPPPSAAELLRALAAAGVTLGASAAPPPAEEEASAPSSFSSSSSSYSAEARLPGLRLLARTIRAAALACIRSSSGGKGNTSSGGNGNASSGKGKGKAAATTTDKDNSTNPFGELPGIELFAALSALRADPVARLAEPELGDAAAAVLGAFLQNPSSSGKQDPESVARLLHAAAEAALGPSPAFAPSSTFRARSALEAVRRVPSSASTAAGTGADVVRALSAALVAARLDEARRGVVGGGGGGKEEEKKGKGKDAARGKSAVAADLTLAFKPSSSSSSSSSSASTSSVLSVAEAAPSAVIAIAHRLLEGECFSLGGAALVRGSPAAARQGGVNAHGSSAAPSSSAPSSQQQQQFRAPRTARLLLEAADEALWPAVEAEVAATAARVFREGQASAAASAAAAAKGEVSPSPPPPAPFSAAGGKNDPTPRSALAARWLPFVRAVDREAARGRGEPDRLLQLAAASMAQRYSVAASAARSMSSGRAAYGRAGAVEMGSPT